MPTIDTAAMLADAEQIEAVTRTVNDARAAVGVGACGGVVEQATRLADHAPADSQGDADDDATD